MNSGQVENQDRAGVEALMQLREAAATEKCWSCGCLHNLLAALNCSDANGQDPNGLKAAAGEANQRLQPVRYDCLGCEVCYAALAMNALHQSGFDESLEPTVCPAENVATRPGWPPLPGAYTVLRYQAPVAVCTLMDSDLAAAVASQAGPEVALVGTLRTENLGIERLILNVLANPNIRFVLVCGPDSPGTVGHFPGQSLVALAVAGLEEQGRINGARGKRPFIRNVPPAAVAHFRQTVQVIDLIGTTDISPMIDKVRSYAALNPGPAEPFITERLITPVAGYLPDRVVPDPAGYCVIYVDGVRRRLFLEHYRNDGVLDALIEGSAAPELYFPAIERGLVSRLDHAAYLGRELARAEMSLRSGELYVQDAAPEYGVSPPRHVVVAVHLARRPAPEMIIESQPGSAVAPKIWRPDLKGKEGSCR